MKVSVKGAVAFFFVGVLLITTPVAATEKQSGLEGSESQAVGTEALDDYEWPLAICSEELSLLVDENGQYNMGVGTDAECVPTGDYWDLMYRWPSGPWSSYTTLRLDGADFRLGLDIAPTDATVTDTEVIHSYDVDDLVVTQHLMLDEAFTLSGVPNTIRIGYTIDNNGGADRDVQLRVLIDTELNYNDGAPFQVPGYGPVTTETEFSGADVPDFFVAFQAFDDTEHIAAGVLRGLDTPATDRVIFGTWPGLYNNVFDYEPTAGTVITFDSGVGAYSAPATLGPGESFSYAIQYGRADVTADFVPPMSLVVLAPTSVAAGDTFTATAFVTNVGEEAITEGFAELVAPAGLAVVGDSLQALPTPMAANESVQVDWTVAVAPDTASGDYEFAVNVGASEVVSKTVLRSVEVFRVVEPAALVALGDSFSSGEGTLNYEPSGERCHRGPDAWPRLLATDSLAADEFDIIGHLACAGAEMHDLYKVFKGEAPQLDELERIAAEAEVELVTVTIGGQDIGFEHLLRECVLLDTSCTNGLFWPRMFARISRVESHLTKDVLPDIQARVPADTRVLLVGYPRLLPEEQAEVTSCGSLRPRERIDLNALAGVIDHRLSQAAENAGAEYVSVLDVLDGHELCTADSWIFPIVDRAPQEGHPIYQGQQAIAEAVGAYLTGP